MQAGGPCGPRQEALLHVHDNSHLLTYSDSSELKNATKFPFCIEYAIHLKGIARLFGGLSIWKHFRRQAKRSRVPFSRDEEQTTVLHLGSSQKYFVSEI